MCKHVHVRIFAADSPELSVVRSAEKLKDWRTGEIFTFEAYESERSMLQVSKRGAVC